ncbi:MAG TPA: hypothetical protein VGB07_14355, partial [Blastocatellia bacterium]
SSKRTETATDKDTTRKCLSRGSHPTTTDHKRKTVVNRQALSFQEKELRYEKENNEEYEEPNEEKAILSAQSDCDVRVGADAGGCRFGPEHNGSWAGC